MQARARDLFLLLFFLLLNAIKNIQNQCQLQNHENIIQMTQWDRFEGFGIVGCKKSVQVRFKVLTEHLETYICAKRILQEKWISLSENVSLSSLVKLWQPNKTSLYNKNKLCEEKACTKIKKNPSKIHLYTYIPQKRWDLDSSSASRKSIKTQYLKKKNHIKLNRVKKMKQFVRNVLVIKYLDEKSTLSSMECYRIGIGHSSGIQYTGEKLSQPETVVYSFITTGRSWWTAVCVAARRDLKHSQCLTFIELIVPHIVYALVDCNVLIITNA